MPHGVISIAVSGRATPSVRRTSATSAEIETAAITVAAVGRLSPATRASVPAAGQRRVITQ